MNLLAIDYGTKKSGIAVNFENIAMPHSIISTDALLNEIGKLVKEREIDGVILGISNHTDGRESEMTKKIRSFSSVLSKKIPKIKIMFHDERFSSFEAEKCLLMAGEKDFDPNHLDDMAACIILQSYLDSKD